MRRLAIGAAVALGLIAVIALGHALVMAYTAALTPGPQPEAADAGLLSLVVACAFGLGSFTAALWASEALR